MFAVTFLYYYEFLPAKNQKKLLLNLFNCGDVAIGEINKYKLLYNRGGHLNFIINVSYHYKENIQYSKKINGSVDSDLDDNLKEKKQIDIIYLKDKPNDFWIYTEKLNNLYNIRKK